MTDSRARFKLSRLYSSLLAAAVSLPALALADGPQTVVLQEFESGPANTVAITTSNSPAISNSNSGVTAVTDNGSGRLMITDSDGGSNGAVLTIPGGIPGPGYYLFTADIKVDNATAPVASYGMAVSAAGITATEISDLNAGYVMNLTPTGGADLGYQTIGAAVNVDNTGTFPRDAAIYFGTDVSSNSYNGPAADGNFVNAHRTNATAWAAGSSNAVYIDNVKRIGPGNMGEERHLWISVGDAFTNLAALDSYLVQAKANNFTAVDILARYRADAYYIPNRTDATYPNPEPLGTRIGTTPVSAENDPLQYAIDRCRELDLKVYISFSTFLVSTTNSYPAFLPSGSIMGYNSATDGVRDMVSADNSNEGLWADLGRQDVRDYTKNVLMDIVTNYDIDGVVFDRIRYPGSRFGYNATALAEMGWTSTPSPFSAAFRTDRRDVVGEFLAECYSAVTTAKPWVVFGSTPIAFGNSMTDTYNNVYQHFPTWTSQKVSNRTVSFGCMDLVQPQFYRLASSAAPFTAPGANTELMKKLQFGDIAVDPADFGLMPGAYAMGAPLFYHPSAPDAGQSNANAQNITDARALSMSGFGFFAAAKTLQDMNLIREPSASTAGSDVMAETPTPVDYLFKSGYDNIPPNAAVNFTAEPQSRGSVVFTWDDPLPASDGDSGARYIIYKSTTQPVREVWANQVTKLPAKGNWFHAPVGEAGSYYYKIVTLDDYNNRGAAVEIGPYTVAGVVAQPDDIIVDNLNATVTGAWSAGTFSADKYGTNYLSRGIGTGGNKVTFNATLPAAGNWQVSEFHPAGSNRAPDARHQIAHANGTAIVTANQQTNGGKFNPLGTYSFNAGSYSVIIDDVFTPATGRVVMADAIRWSYVPTPVATPAQPTNLVATPVSHNQINLTWQDNATNESGYELERTICGGSTVVIQLPAGTTSYADSLLAPDTEYKYVIRAWATGTQSADSNRAAARTLPHVPEDIIIDNPQATLFGAWGVSSAAGMYGSNYLQGFASSVRRATFSFIPERTAVYEVYEWHVAGTNRTTGAPHVVNYANGGSETVSVNQRLSGGQWNKIGQWLFTGQATQSVIITNAFPVGSGTVVMADAIKIVYKAEPPTTPAAPSDLEAVAISHSEVGLTWQDNAINETSYEIERTKVGGQPEVIAAVAADSVSYMDTGLEALTGYTYVVRAVNGQGSSANSNTASVTTLSSTPPDQIIDNLDADLVGSWAFGTFSADKYATNYAFRSKSATGSSQADFAFTARDTGLYEVFEWHPQGANRAGDAEHIITHAYGSETVIVNQQSRGGQWNTLGTYAFNGGTSYNVAITDKFTIGDSVMADAIKVVWTSDLPSDPPASPSTLTATPVGGSQIELSWTDTTNNEQRFEIVRNGNVLTTVGPNVTGYSDTAVSECTPYSYAVRSVVYGVPSANSNVVSVSLDVTKPVITAPADVAVNTDAGLPTASSVALGSPVVTDNCDASPVVTSNAPGTFAVGETVVTWTAKDAKGNEASVTQKVVVTDNEAPAITVAGDVLVTASIVGCFAENVQLGSAATSDNTGVATVVNDAPTTYPVGVTQVTWVVTDIYGNTASAVQTVTVNDNPAEAPASSSATALNWDRVRVSWSDVSNETLFEVRYATALAGPYTVAGSTAADNTEFEVTGLMPNTQYFFVVEARNACGSADSSVATATTPYYSGSSVNPETGESWESVDDPNAEGGSYVIRARRSTDDSAAWNMTIPVSGTYEISVYIPNVDHLSTQANYKITNGSNVKTKIINQRQNVGSWVVLGQYQFTSGQVKIDVFQPNNSSNPVVVDGLRINQLN